ncbi:ABC transporter permease [Miniphocaeibacter massiliensis]|uniref:ABC transporter permease n=1 Tax=Miniphocaeibacter massiliensis TaxID=2041841 RepID=UPI0013EC8EE8|nr:ABC transporter permease [Miniphocaeibacter massiliensis]
MNSKLSKRLISYELRNATGNIWSILFGLVFPVIMGIIIYKGSLSSIPKDFAKQFATILYISFTAMTINSILLIGYGVNLSLELAEKITLRLNLFGISQKTLVLGKLIAQLIVFAICYFMYTVVLYLAIGIETPTFIGALIYLISILLLCIISFVFAHGIANLFQKFGPTYAVSMVIMLGTMLLGGMMGVKVEQFPKIIQNISYMLPYTYISQDFYKVWIGESYNFVPFIQSILFYGGLSVAILLFSFYYRRRK